jgi:hypothetical protein
MQRVGVLLLQVCSAVAAAIMRVCTCFLLTLLLCLTMQAPKAADRGDQNPPPARKRQHTAAANVDLHDLTLLGEPT